MHEEGIAPISLDAVLAAQRDGAVVVDTRDQKIFNAGHLRGSVNVGLEGRFAEFSGDVVRPGTDRPARRAGDGR